MQRLNLDSTDAAMRVATAIISVHRKMMPFNTARSSYDKMQTGTQHYENRSTSISHPSDKFQVIDRMSLRIVISM